MQDNNQFNPGNFAVHNGKVACILEINEQDDPDDNVRIEYVVLDANCTPITTDDFQITFTGLKQLQPLSTAEQFLMAAAYTLAYQRNALEEQLEAKRGEILSLAAAIKKLKNA